jgi:hypothetical protein
MPINEVTLKMSLEISSVTGVQNIGGFNQPTIGQRRIEHEARLADGEVNLIGGILEDTDTNSMSGYPLDYKIPILKYLFGQETKERQQSEIVFAITPHIIRGGEVTDENLKMVDVGQLRPLLKLQIWPVTNRGRSFHLCSAPPWQLLAPRMWPELEIQYYSGWVPQVSLLRPGRPIIHVVMGLEFEIQCYPGIFARAALEVSCSVALTPTRPPVRPWSSQSFSIP